MMTGFRRAQLRGSDELFRPTAPVDDVDGPVQHELAAAPPPSSAGDTPPPAPIASAAPAEDAPSPLPESARIIKAPTVGDAPEPAAAPPAGAPTGERSLHLSVEEIEILSDAVQRLKFPGKAGTRPRVDDFERLEELRQKLLSFI